MSRIRKLYYFDKKNMQEMISFLNNRDAYINHIMFNPCAPLHHLLPLKLKFLPESYLLKDKKEIKGLITIAPSKNPVKRLEILRLFFEENCYEDAEELIRFVLSKYKAIGAISFLVKIDETLTELIQLFVSKCDFSQISYERLWKVPMPDNLDFNPKEFRVFRNSDAYAVSNLFNDSLLPHFRMLLESDSKEFKEPVFKGLSYFSEYKYVMEDKNSKNLYGYISIKTSDDKNFIIDLTQSVWAEINLHSVISFAITQIQKRQKDFNLFIKTKKYTQVCEQNEQLLREHNFECVQNQMILTNSSAKIIKDRVKSGRFTILNQFGDSRLDVPG